jgi:flagellar hook assembly protein FlgD
VTSLNSAAPNPFRSSTVLRFSLAARGPIDLALYSVSGRRIRTLASGMHEVGFYNLNWDGRDQGGQAMATGVYFARLRTDKGSFNKTVTLIK